MVFPGLEESGELANRELKRNNSAENHINSQKPEQTKTVHIWLRLLILILIVGGLTVILYETGVIQFFLNKKRMAHFLDSLGPWSVVVFVLLQVAQVVAAPIPGEVTGFLGGYVFGKFFGVRALHHRTHSRFLPRLHPRENIRPATHRKVHSEIHHATL